MQVLGELICRPALDPGEIDREREVIIEEIRGYLDDPAEYAQILFQQAMFGESALGREICGEKSDVRGLPRGIRDFWASTYRPANAVVAVAGDLGTTRPSASRAARSGAATARDPRLRARARAARRRASATGKRDTTQAQLGVGVPALPPRPSRRVGARGPQRDPRRRDERACSSRSSIGTRWPTTSPRAGRVRRRRRAPGHRRASIPAGRTGARRDPRELARRSATRSSRPTSSPRPRPTSPAGSSCGWRRRATSRRGSAGRRRSTSASSPSTRRSRRSRRHAGRPVADRQAAVPGRRVAAGGRRAGPPLRGLDRHLRLPHDARHRGHRRGRRPDRDASTFGSGQLTLARAELEDLLGRDASTNGIAALAEVRWRTGDAGGAAGRGGGPPRSRRDRRVAICIAAEAAAADGVPVTRGS